MESILIRIRANLEGIIPLIPAPLANKFLLNLTHHVFNLYIIYTFLHKHEGAIKGCLHLHKKRLGVNTAGIGPELIRSQPEKETFSRSGVEPETRRWKQRLENTEIQA